MCGIVGILQYKSDISREIRNKVLRLLFPDLMVRTEARGDDATGVYQVHADGDWLLLKKGEKSSEWVFREAHTTEDPAILSDLFDSWDLHPHELKVLVGHCRKATVGGRGKDNEDNHPFSVQLDGRNAILGVHNGTLNNHERIFAKLREMGSPLTRQGTVDSEAIFHLLFHASASGTLPWDAESVKYAADKISGAQAIICVNTRFPNQVLVTRDTRPMEAIMVAPLNMVFLISEKKFLDEALANYRIGAKFLDRSLPEVKIEARAVLDGHFRIFDLNRPFPKILSWNSLDEISTDGPLRKTLYAEPPAEWKGSSSSTASRFDDEAEGYAIAYAKGAAALAAAATNPPSPTTGTAATKPEPPKQLAATVPPAAKTETAAGAKTPPLKTVELAPKDVVTTTEMEEVLAEARYLGLCPTFDSEGDLAAALGTSTAALGRFVSLDAANKMAPLFFSQGYALGLSDSAKEVEDTLDKGKMQGKRLERAMEKHSRAQASIWELRQAIVAATILAENGFVISERNMRAVLHKFGGLEDERREQIINAFKSATDDTRAKKARSDIKEGIELQRKQKQEASRTQENQS